MKEGGPESGGDGGLKAVLFSDMRGYSALMSADEERALRLVEEHDRICTPIVALHHGRLIKKMGDALMVSFGSGVDAVDCAVDIQEALARHNEHCPDDDQIIIRIGIHAGEVIERDGDLFGHGVNLAARLEPLAPPGGIAVSETVVALLKARPKFVFQPAGQHQVKNIDEPVTVFHVGFGDASVAAAEPEAGRRWRRSKPVGESVPWWTLLKDVARGSALSLPFVIGMVVLLFGGLGGIHIGGPFMGLVLLSAALAGGIGLARARLQRAGRARLIAGWLLAPSLAALWGILGTGAGLIMAQGALEYAPLESRSMLSGMGVSIALITELSGLGLESGMLLATAGFLAWNYRVHFAPGKGLDPIAQRCVIAAIGVGSVLWMVHQFLFEGPAPFVIFLVLVAASVACAAVAGPLPTSRVFEAALARVQVAACVVCGVGAAVWAVQVHSEHTLFGVVGHASPTDQFIAAEQFGVAVGQGTMLLSMAWAAAALAVAIIPCRGTWTVLKTQMRWGRQAFLLVALLGVVSWLTHWSVTEKTRVADRVVPAYLANATHHVFGVWLEDAPSSETWAGGGARVLPESCQRVLSEEDVEREPDRFVHLAGSVEEGACEGPAGPLEVDDVIVAVRDRPVSGLSAMAKLVRSCLCEPPEGAAPCDLPGDCLAPGGQLVLSVVREGRLLHGLDMPLSLQSPDSLP